MKFLRKNRFFSDDGPALLGRRGTQVCGVLMAMLLLGVAGGCGKSAPTAIPAALIKDYVAKHTTMVDDSLTNLYVSFEQDAVAEKVSDSIDAKEAEGTLEDLQSAVFDFSGLELQLLGEKKGYVNDEIKSFLKVALKGHYIMNAQGRETDINVDKVVILEKEDGTWKITETVNPWS